MTKEQAFALQQNYAEEKDRNVAKVLLKYYISTNNFSSAYDLLAQMKENNHIASLSKDVTVFVAFNYDIQLSLAQKTPAKNTLLKDEILNSSLAGEKDMYALLYLLYEKNYSAYDEKLVALSKDKGVHTGAIVSSLLYAKQTYKTLKEAPSYYYTGLIALSLLQGGYFPLAKAMATDVLREDS